MSRLDRHVAFVQSKLAFGRFLAALALTILAFCAAVWLGLLIDRLFHLHPPRPLVFVWAGLGVAVLIAIVYSLVRKPTAHEAAVAIDERLGLKEKFSTALFVRNDSRDPFAVAAVRDAERTADNVSLHKQFPLTFPRMGYWTVAAALVVLLTAWLVPTTLDLFGKEAQHKKMALVQAERDAAKHQVEKALATVNSYPKEMQSQEAIQMAKRDLEKLLSQPITDPAQANRTAFKALEQSNEALKEEVKKNERFAMAEASQKMLRSMSPPSDEQGPVADAQRDIAKGNFTKAMDEMNQVAQKFDKMSDAEQQKATQQMQNVAKQVQKMAQDPQQMKQLQQQLQNQGLNQQQAQQLAKAMQQAAAGDKDAQKQLQQMQQQAMQQMQQQQGASPQQMAKAQQLMKQMQAQAQSQATAQQMAQAAQQMAQAMQQGSSKQGNQQNSNQQGQMAQAQQQMQQAMAQMDAVQKDAEQLSAAQANAQQAADEAAQQANGQGNDTKGGQPQAGRGVGQWKPGDPRGKKGNGQGGPGQGNGGGIGKEEAPYAIKKEAAPVQDIENGKILASTFVKAGTVKGESKVELSKVAEAAMKDATDEVDEESVSKESQKVVKDYFETMQKGE